MRKADCLPPYWWLIHPFKKKKKGRGKNSWIAFWGMDMCMWKLVRGHIKMNAAFSNLWTMAERDASVNMFFCSVEGFCWHGTQVEASCIE